MGNTCSGEKESSSESKTPKSKSSPMVDVELKDNDSFIKNLISELKIDEYSSFESLSLSNRRVKLYTSSL